MGRLKRGAVVVIAAVGLTAVAPAMGQPPTDRRGGGVEIVQRGACSDGADWTLSVSLIDKRLLVAASVDSSRARQRWRWVLKHNGSVTARGAKKTVRPRGAFTVRRRVVELRETDKIVFRAKHRGQVCRGVVNY